MKSSILFVDRDPGLAEAVRRTLTARGYPIHACSDGLSCLRILKDFCPTLLVLDSQILWGGSEGVLECLVTDFSLMPLMTVVTADEGASPVADRLDPWVDLQITRPKSIDDLLPFVSQLETLAWWSLSPDLDTAPV